MKILQVVPFFSPVHGGSAIAPYQLSKELTKRGHEVAVFTSDYKLSREWVESSGQVKVYSFKTWSSWSKFYLTPTLIKAAKEGLEHFDLIHMHNYRTFQNIVIAHYAKKHGVPYVLQAHGSIPRIMAKQRLKWIYDVLFGYRLLRSASKVIALSRVEAEQYKDMSVPEEKIVIIPNGIDLSEYADLPPKGCFREKFGIKEEEKIVLYLGRIHRIKGLDILVEAFAKVIEDLDDVRLVVVGPDDGYLGELKALINALRIEDNVLILGPLYGDDKLEAYVDADVYVLPSRYETFPMGLLEAVACGTPIILTRNCGIAEYFENKAGLLVDPDSDKLYEALFKMLTDHDTRNSFRKKGKTAISEFEISNVVSKLEELYANLAK